jgi:23S rRNA-/tRNA-specific pseudouridylate synthase
LGRIEMQKLKDLVNVYYIDTDLIVVNKEDLSLIKNRISGDFGDLKVEGS